MTEILRRWLNEEVGVKPEIVIGDGDLAEKFSNGYLFGLILQKYDLQPNLHLFSKGNTSEAKLNNYTLLEPNFKLLQIPFSFNTARDLMMEVPGVATRLTYQLFLALNKKKDHKWTTQSLECMRPSGKITLERVETDIYKDRLKQQTVRQVDLNFQQLAEKYSNRFKIYEEKIAQLKREEEERMMEERKLFCRRSLEITRATREKNSSMYKNIKPMTPANRAKSTPNMRRDGNQTSKRSVAQETMRSIDEFESSVENKVSVTMSGSMDVQTSAAATVVTSDSFVPSDNAAASSEDYMAVIRQRVSDSCTAHAQREKRRRRVLVEQMKALHEQEEAKRKRMLVERLNKQSQQERRISTQMMQIRKEKDTIRNNRILRLQQYRKEREQEYIDYLNRLAGESRLEEEEQKKRLKHHQKLYQSNLAKKAQMNYEANYSTCYDIVLQILDFGTKLAHYRELTNNLVPAKIVLDWKALFIAGRPLYESDALELGNSIDLQSSFMTTVTSMDGLRPATSNDRVLNDIDFNDYENAQSEWSYPAELAEDFPLHCNRILSHAVYRVLDIVDPPKSPPTPPHTPRCMLRASAVGKPYTGKTNALEHIREMFGMVVISVESITKKAVETYLSESKALQTQPSTSVSNIDYVDVAEDVGMGRRSEAGGTPLIQVAKSSTTSIGALQKGEEDGLTDDEKGNVDVRPSTLQLEEASQLLQERSQLSQDMLQQFSPLALLGNKAHLALVNGEPLDDELLNSIFIHEIRSLPEGCGWILDDYPTTTEQAKLLFTSLTGQSRPRRMIPREFVLLGDTKRDMSVLQAASGLDVVLNFDATTQTILQRASMQGDSSKLGQIQERLVKYHDRWRPLQKWYSKFKIVCTVNGMMDLQSVCEVTAEKIEESIKKIKQSEAIKKLGLSETRLNSGSVVSLTSVTTSPTKRSQHSQTPPPSLRRRPSSARLSLESSLEPQDPVSPLPTKQETSWAPVNLELVPGSIDWKFYDQPLSSESAEGLAKKWPAIEASYINTLKEIFQKLRHEREIMCEYFFIRRKQFSTYLCRPDHKQEFIAQWQQYYNGLDISLRHEDVMKAELHHRVDDLTDKLWDICEQRKVQANKERKRIADEQWLEDHIGLLSNYYISIMQAELDRFQDTYLFIKDYYDAMENKTPDKLPDPGRLQLIEISVTEPQEISPSQEGSSANIDKESPPPEGDNKEKNPGNGGKEEQIKLIPILPRQPVPDPPEEKGGKKKGGGGAIGTPIAGLIQLSGQDLDEQLINYVYNQGLTYVHNLINGELKLLDGTIADVSKPPPAEKSQELGDSKDDQKGGKGKRAKSPAQKKSPSLKKSPQPKKSPVPKKKNNKGSGKTSSQPPESEQSATKAPVITPDVVMKRHSILHRCKEYKEAIVIEEKRLKARLRLVRLKSLSLMKLMKDAGNDMQEEMGSWMESCYNQEIESVSHLADLLRHAIENEQKLLHEIVLPGAKFNIDKDVITFIPSPPPSPPPPVEQPHSSFFTVAQLQQLFLYIKSSTSTGFILVRSLVNNLLQLVKGSSKDGTLPQVWRGTSKKQLETIVKMLYGRSATNVDWRRLLVCVAQPWPVPTTQQLVYAWRVLASDETETMGVVTISKEKFMRTEIWLDCPPMEESEEERDALQIPDDTTSSSEKIFNRIPALKEVLFNMLCEKNGMLDVTHFLLYLCADPQYMQGLFKALSVVTRTHVLSLKEVDPEAVISLEDFHLVLSWGSHKDTVTVTRASLFDVFVQVNPSNPNEVLLADLFNHHLIINILQSCYNFYLPDLQQVFGPSDGKIEVPA